jgi:flagella basal body P-ring formation protein FlgA
MLFVGTKLCHQQMVTIMRKGMKILYVLWLCMIISNAQAASYQSHDSIHAAVQQFMTEHTEAVYEQPAEIKNGQLDSRLRLNQCSLPLEVYLPVGSRDIGRLTVGVKCTGANPWSLHVPVTVTVYKNVIVAAKSLSRGEVLTESDFKPIKYDISQLPAGYIEDSAYGIGMELKRRLATGVPLTKSMMIKPKIIKRGQHVSIVARAGGMEVRMSGKALAHGAVGDRIRVLNVKSKKKLEGTVTPSGDIKVDI